MTTEKIFPKRFSNYLSLPTKKTENLIPQYDTLEEDDLPIPKGCDLRSNCKFKFPGKMFFENKFDSTSDSSNSNSFSKSKVPKKIISAFSRRGGSFATCRNDIFLYPTMYQKLVSTSEKLGLKFHLLCKFCQDNIFFSENNYSNNNLPNLKIDLVHNFLLKPEKKGNFSQKFEISNMKKKRKMDRDCIHKKIKARLFKYIKEMLKNYIVEEFSNLKIQQKVISDVTLVFNKKLLSNKLSTVFVESNFYFNSSKQISEISKKDKEEDLAKFLNKSVGECYQDYLHSEHFEKDIEKFKNESYIDTFKSYCLSFIEYYNQDSNYRKLRKSEKL
jgi:hypothetical protein